MRPLLKFRIIAAVTVLITGGFPVALRPIGELKFWFGKI
jgi:hypothetical protein